MSETSNCCLNFVESNKPSFFIHFAYPNVTEQTISKTLEELNLGIVSQISLKPTTNNKNENGNSIVVHFNEWFRNQTADKVRIKLINGDSIKINYTHKSYLHVIAFQPKNKPRQHKIYNKPTITFDDKNESTSNKIQTKSTKSTNNHIKRTLGHNNIHELLNDTEHTSQYSTDESRLLYSDLE